MSKVKVSLVIPTYNKKPFLQLALQALRQQILPRECFEVVVVVDGSNDGTIEYLESLSVDYTLRFLVQENRGRAPTRNRGVEAAEGELVVFIDDDCICEPAFLSAHVRYHEQYENCLVTGYRHHYYPYFSADSAAAERQKKFLNTKPSLQRFLEYGVGQMFLTPDDLAQHVTPAFDLCFRGESQRIHQLLDRYGSDLNGFRAPWLITSTSNLSVRKQALEEVGGFDTNFIGWGYEDFELGYRLFKHGLRFLLSQEAVVYRAIHRPTQGVLLEEIESKVQNYAYMCRKYPRYEMMLQWLVSTKEIDIITFHELLLELDRYPASTLKNDFGALTAFTFAKFGTDKEWRRSIER
jgi:glycosyltransferase involved in cell wall biosynthesis